LTVINQFLTHTASSTATTAIVDDALCIMCYAGVYAWAFFLKVMAYEKT